ncbi:hypothetical protein Nm8I071_63140 [Nonomuraea sp. TT08I-71]|nr:hypothetical protein Nm8I071_63140 [Nonomuraea sp. TT08I-71]
MQEITDGSGTTQNTSLGAAMPPEPGSGRGRSHGTSSSEPFDRWFRYPAGFASDYVSLLLGQLGLKQGSLIVDPFAGTAVTGTSARSLGHSFVGIEAHPAIAELAAIKLQQPPGDPRLLLQTGRLLVEKVRVAQAGYATEELPELVRRCFTPEVLSTLIGLRQEISASGSPWGTYLKWGLLGTLRDVASVRVGWPYQNPGMQRKPRHSDPFSRFVRRLEWMTEDLQNWDWAASQQTHAVVAGDSTQRSSWETIAPASAAGCVSSPPYLNNFDYADATRLELYFWGEVKTWAEMCSVVRAGMVTATTQQSSVVGAKSAADFLARHGRVAEEVKELVAKLRDQRMLRPRGKEYDRVVPEYFASMSQVLANLSLALAAKSRAVWLVGDSAPYGVYIDTPGIIGKLAREHGFRVEQDVKLRKRGQRWSGNAARHNLELSERLILLRRE